MRLSLQIFLWAVAWGCMYVLLISLLDVRARELGVVLSSADRAWAMFYLAAVASCTVGMAIFAFSAVGDMIQKPEPLLILIGGLLIAMIPFYY
jgi:hypothetical protein